jgi:hypothetical protein
VKKGEGSKYYEGLERDEGEGKDQDSESDPLQDFYEMQETKKE